MLHIASPDSTLTAPRRAICARCQRPLRGCLCAWQRPTANQVPVLILQHPLEQHHAKGTARWLQLSLQQCRTEVGERFDAAQLSSWLSGPTPALLLYPLDPLSSALPADAKLKSMAMEPGPAPRLIVLDGTWRKTAKLLQANPLLQRLPRWPLPAPPPSMYAIRKAQRPEHRSTLEAVCHALAALEKQPARYAPLLQSFEAWVVEQMALTAALSTARSR